MMWVLRNKPSFSKRATSSLNPWAISLAQLKIFKGKKIKKREGRREEGREGGRIEEYNPSFKDLWQMIQKQTNKQKTTTLLLWHADLCVCVHVHVSFETRSHCVVQTNLKHIIPLPQLSECWDHRYMPHLECGMNFLGLTIFTCS